MVRGNSRQNVPHLLGYEDCPYCNPNDFKDVARRTKAAKVTMPEPPREAPSNVDLTKIGIAQSHPSVPHHFAQDQRCKAQMRWLSCRKDGSSCHMEACPGEPCVNLELESYPTVTQRFGGQTSPRSWPTHCVCYWTSLSFSRDLIVCPLRATRCYIPTGLCGDAIVFGTTSVLKGLPSASVTIRQHSLFIPFSKHAHFPIPFVFPALFIFRYTLLDLLYDLVAVDVHWTRWNRYIF